MLVKGKLSDESMPKIVKYINDPVYGGIPISKIELDIINTPIFQRLRGLKQLAHLNYVFPGAEHSRFVHSLGVLYIMGIMTEHLSNSGDLKTDDVNKLRVAALLHDIGHYPLSHLGETVYSYFQDNKNAESIIEEKSTDNKVPLYQLASVDSKSANHELLGHYIVTHNNDIKSILESNGLDPEEIGDIFTGRIGSRNMVYSQLLHSSLDADRLDYLLRDSYQTGVRYGLVDLQYLVRLLMVVEEQETDGSKRNTLACNKKGQHVIEHFLMSRYFHYSQVIFHKTSIAFECMIKAMFIKLLQNNTFMYNTLDEIKSGINDYNFLNFNDASLSVALKSHFEETDDEEYKCLYRMYAERIRPKVIFDVKDLYDESPGREFSILERELKRYPEKISAIVGSDKWGYHIATMKIEKIHSRYPLTEIENIHNHIEELREAVKLYDSKDGNISYLAQDKFSVINRLAHYESKFIRIFVLEERENRCNYDELHRQIKELIQS